MYYFYKLTNWLFFMSLELKVNTQSNIQEFIPQMLYHMGEMCKDHAERIQSIQDPEFDISKVKSVLSKGLWYPPEYCQVLEKFNQKNRLNWMIKNGAPFHSFMPTTFTPIEDAILPTKRKLDQYKIAKDVTPSRALESIQDSICLIGCGTARDIAVYRTLQDLLGKKRFDLLFTGDSNTPLQLGTNNNSYERLFKRVELRSTASLQPGDFCHFSNIQYYVAKHPFGHARGYNAICEEANKEDSRFLALGLKPGCLATDVENALLDGFNAPQYSETFFTPSILSYVYGKTLLRDEQRSKELVESLKDCKLTQEQFDTMPNRDAHASIKAERRMLLSVERPDLDKIKMLVEAPLENIRKVFSRLSS
jgi:hypothetical protein